MAASEFKVVSPLSELTKQEVRDIAKYLGLPNWNAAASPCLRSRLQFGVEATQVGKRLSFFFFCFVLLRLRGVCLFG